MTTSGVAGVITLYDEKGNAVQVKLVDGQYRLVVVDEQTQRTLETISLQLAELIDLLKSHQLSEG